jgi:GNAT superfamily N-acetyltransferase
LRQASARRLLPPVCAAEHRDGVGKTYVLRKQDEGALPEVLGFYTVSMANIESALASSVMKARFPRYPLPVVLLGRLAVDARAQGRRVGERLLMDAFRRVLQGAEVLGCIGIIVDAKDEAASAFYGKYDFVSVSAEGWPRRLFISLATVREAFAGEPRF